MRANQLIRTANRNQLSVHATDIHRAATHYHRVIGSTSDEREVLVLVRTTGDMLRIGVVIGQFTLTPVVVTELALGTIGSLKVLGTLQASPEIRAALGDWLTYGRVAPPSRRADAGSPA